MAPERARAPELRIVHLDDDLAVIDKPAGLVVHPAPSHTGPTLVSELGDLLGGGDPERPGIVHRLDKETSGLMVVARNPEALAALQEAVRERQVERRYLALAGGRLGSRTGTIDAPIGRATQAPHPDGGRRAPPRARRAPISRCSSCCRARATSRPAWRPAARTRSAPISPRSATRWPATPPTAARPGTACGASSSTPTGSPSRHPRTGAPLDFSSPLPADLEAALEAARAE